MTNVYTIPESAREEVRASIDRLAKKAQKYGAILNVSFGEPYYKTFAVHAYDPAEHVMYKAGKCTYQVFDATVESTEIKLDGYTVVARIEHGEKQNIVESFGAETKLEWLSLVPHCDHCGCNHVRVQTFIVRNDIDGTEKQVGSTCLQDYCGIDPQAVIASKSARDILARSECYDDEDFEGRGVPKYFDTVSALAHAIDVVKKQGYIKSGEANSNKGNVAELLSTCAEASKEATEKARAMVETLKAMTAEEALKESFDVVRGLALEGYCKYDHFGYIACFPVMYDRWMKRKEERAEEGKASNFVGGIGERITVAVDSFILLTSWFTEYGTTFLYKFTDNSGNVYIWKASNEVTANVKTVKGTVKDHNERDGVRQTVMTRCKVA